MMIEDFETRLAALIADALAGGLTHEEIATKLGEKCDEVGAHAE